MSKNKMNKVQEAVEAVVDDNTAKALEALQKLEGQNKSTKIRALDALGFKRGEIAKALGIRYQHVRNVLITPVKRPVTKSAE